eukprot:Nitzschia sp. Nitz4//scaffold109_size72162//39281//39898//NITZ4_005849-RA/size72162-processed-gene-0.14-mRNA-1//1//CDS//3329532772//105//frame0
MESENKPMPVAVAVAPGSTNLSSSSNVRMRDQPKQGALCCGCCCDYRRAVIVMNIITILFSLGTILTVLDVVSFREFINFDDDQVEEIWDDSIKKAGIYAAISIVCSICALVGANKFNMYLVLVNIFWIIIWTLLDCLNVASAAKKINDYVSDVTLTIVGNIISSIIFGALCIYPHAGFCKEVHEGIMTYETYPREEHSCCCTAI